MKDRIDPLIEDRAPWLFSSKPFSRTARAALDLLLGYETTVALAESFRYTPAGEIMDTMAEILARDVRLRGLSHIPRRGPALLVANHPTGIADGIMLHHALRGIRDDAYFFANSDLLRVLPQFSDRIVPVEWRPEKRSHAKARDTMVATRTAVKAGRLGVIFPSGRLAKRRGLKLHERPWMASAAMIARKYDLPVIPVNIRARNSALFYIFDRIHPSLRDVTLFHETLNKARQPYVITAGAPISARALLAASDEAIEILRAATLAIGGRHAPNVSLVDSTRRPGWA